MAETNVHSGHRNRMRDKFFRHGAQVFDSYELLEMLLYYRIPYKDTNPIAHRLLSRFGTLDNVFCADVRELCEVDGVGEQVAQFIRSAGFCGVDGFLLKEKEQVFTNYQYVGEYLLSAYERDGDLDQIYLLLLDNRMRPLALEPVGHMEHVFAKDHLLIQKALLASAAVAVLATHHNGGLLGIMPEDVALDDRLRKSFEVAGIVYAEHYIFKGNAFISSFTHKATLICQYQALQEFEDSRRKCQKSGMLRSPVKAPTTAADVCDIGDSAREYLARLIEPACSASKRDAALRGMLGRFGMVRRIFEADATNLAETPGVGRSLSMYIKLLVAVTSRRFTDAFSFGTIHTAEQIERYFACLLMGEHVECMYMLMMDDRGAVIACECVGEGSVNSSHITPRRVLEIAVHNRAKQVILAHNHPSGIAHPSDDDYSITTLLQQSLNVVNIKLLDHYVVAGNACISLSAFSKCRINERYTFEFAPAPSFYRPTLKKD